MNINILKYCLIYFCLITFSNTVIAQVNNLVHNAGFEDSHDNTKPDDCAQIPKTGSKYIEVWRSRLKEKKINKKPVFIHSPEWHRDGSGYYDLLQIDAQEGHSYVSMGTCELIQQKFFVNKKLVYDEEYTVQMYIRLKTTQTTDRCRQNNGAFFSTARLKVWVSKGKFRYSSAADKVKNICEEKYCDKDVITKNTDKIKIMDELLTLSKYPPGAWHLVTSTFTAPSSFAYKYDWFVIEVEPVDRMCKSYVSIDNVTLAKSCEVGCDKGCSRTDGAVNIKVHSFVTNDEPFAIWGLKNTFYAQLIIYSDILGQTVIYTGPTINCTNGISDTITWDGKNNSGANVAAQFYYYRLNVKNDCSSNCSFTGSLFKAENFQGTTAPIVCYNGSIKVPEPCCCLEPDIFIDNVTFTSPGVYDYHAINNIYIGPNVTVNDGAELILVAGNEINGEADITVEPGAEISADIIPCNVSCRLAFSDNTKTDITLTNDTIFTNKDEFLESYTTASPIIAALPNPFKVNVIFEYELEQDGPVELFISNIQGQKIEALVNETNKPAGRHLYLYYASHLKPGIYLYTLKTKDHSITKRLVVLK